MRFEYNKKPAATPSDLSKRRTDTLMKLGIPVWTVTPSPSTMLGWNPTGAVGIDSDRNGIQI